jgi:hypothetical protein
MEYCVFRTSKGDGRPEGQAQGATPCEYEILISSDGQEWRPVASSADRAPWSERVGLERLRPEVITAEVAGY